MNIGLSLYHICPLIVNLNLPLMSKKNITPAFNSPILQTCTPIRRLGLSRKRKKCDSEEKLHVKLQAHDLADTPTSSHFKQLSSSQNGEDFVDKPRMENSLEKTIKNDVNLECSEDCDDELDEIIKRIKEKEEKLESLDKQKNKILELENLIDIWKTGCKNVYLYLLEIIKQKESANFDYKIMLENLGIWNTMIEIFENDPDITLIENSK